MLSTCHPYKPGRRLTLSPCSTRANIPAVEPMNTKYTNTTIRYIERTASRCNDLLALRRPNGQQRNCHRVRDEGDKHLVQRLDHAPQRRPQSDIAPSSGARSRRAVVQRTSDPGRSIGRCNARRPVALAERMCTRRIRTSAHNHACVQMF